MDQYIHLSEMQVGERAVVEGVFSPDEAFFPMHRRLLDLGFVPGAAVECVGKSPCGDPLAYRIRSAVVAIRAADGRLVLLRRE